MKLTSRFNYELQVLGNAKGAVAVVVSILIFKNPVSVTGMLGYSLTVLGVILYSEAKKRSKWKRNLQEREKIVFLPEFGPEKTYFCPKSEVERSFDMYQTLLEK